RHPARRAYGLPRERVHGGEVAGVAREGDDVASRGAGSVPLLDLRDRAEDLEDLFGLRAELAARLALGEDLLMHGGVLTHLQLGQVEPERLDLPEQLLQAAVGLPRGAAGDEGVLDDPQ